MKNIDSDLIRGNIDTIILKTMLDGDKYGLDIIKEVETRSNGTYELKQPTLYSCLKRLENQGLISSYWLDSDIGGRRHYYKLTEKGHEFYDKKQEEWAKSKFIIDNLLSNYNYDEYRLVKKDDYDKIIEGRQFDYSPTQQAPATQPAEAGIENNASPEESNEGSSDESFEDVEKEINDILENTISSDEVETSQNEENPDEDYEYTNEESDLEEFNNLNADETNESIQESEETFSVLEEKPEEIETFENSKNFAEDEDVEETQSPASNEPERKYYVQIDDDETEAEETPSPVYEQADQTQFETNILQRLRQQENDEINTYVGDQKSYVNHLNTATEDSIQESLLDIVESDEDDEINKTINEFESSITKLNNLDFSEDEELEEVEEIEPVEEFAAENNLETFEEEQLPELDLTITEKPFETEIEEIEENKSFEAEETPDDFLNELSSLHSNNTNGFFNSFDSPEYDAQPPTTKKVEHLLKEPINYDFSFTEQDSSDAAFDDETFEKMYSPLSSSNDDNDSYDDENNYELNSEESDYLNESFEETDNNFETNYTSFSDSFDNIISKNITSYSDPVETKIVSEQTLFTPKFTSGSAKEKLSSLSEYSKITYEETKRSINQDALNKAKDIDSLKAELEQEGIKFKEYRKHSANELAEKTYLLVNKINLIKSLILLFGYMFILSATFIILNNTSFKNNLGFSLSYFLYGIIPFAIYTIYHLVRYLISPYKKGPAKFAPRIMMFISIIITIQLLLITYCVNLQLGFYSFTQSHYNHLFWLIPTIVSFAPIFSTVTHMALFYSKNFNV
ncbi:MAG: helix-turn-helix transcriptional regulator [Clostridia bacterium]|nr:helix-turn-helix transcriptional regulator [Clostridia bacterium]